MADNANTAPAVAGTTPDELQQVEAELKTVEADVTADVQAVTTRGRKRAAAVVADVATDANSDVSKVEGAIAVTTAALRTRLSAQAEAAHSELLGAFHTLKVKIEAAEAHVEGDLASVVAAFKAHL